MARKGKNVYDRIEDKRGEIREAEETLKRLNEELQVLFKEKDELEMKQLLEQMKANQLDITQAINLLNKQTKTK